MDKPTYEIIVVFKNGQQLILNHVTEHGMYPDRIASVVTNGYRQFFNFDEILYWGRTFDLMEGLKNDG